MSDTINQPGTFTTPGTYTVKFVIGSPAATFQGPGNYDVKVEAALFATPTVYATNGANVTITATGVALSSPNFVIEGGSTLSFKEVYSAFEQTNVSFSNGGGTVILPPGVASFGNALAHVNGFGAGDQIDFGTSLIDPTDKIVFTPNANDTNGVLTLESANGQVIGSVQLNGSYNASDFKLGPYGIDFACFLRGTLILTPEGDRAVETLRAGDEVVTAYGPRAVKAVRTRSFAGDMTASAKIKPVRIAAGALGEGLPHSDLFVSPDHAMFLDGVLVPAALLIDGTTITQTWDGTPVEYIHVEVEPHGILYANGAATESYLDIGNRGHFGRPGAVGLSAAGQAKGWEDACAPLVLAGPRLAGIKARLAAAPSVKQAA